MGATGGACALVHLHLSAPVTNFLISRFDYKASQAQRKIIWKVGGRNHNHDRSAPLPGQVVTWEVRILALSLLLFQDSTPLITSG